MSRSSAFWNITHAVSCWLLYLLAHCIYTSLRNLFWWLNGTYNEIWSSREPQHYGRSAHVMRILFSYRVDEFVESRLSDFVLTHERFTSPEYVLKDDVLLLQITTTEAIFIEKRRGSRPVEDFDFFIMGALHAPVRLITMPLSSLHRLADSMPANEAKIIFLQNEARCGGSLFTGLFKSTGRCIALNELHAMNAICKYRYIEERWSRTETVQMLRSVVRLVCKPRTERDQPVLAYLIKPMAMSIICADLIPEALPEAIQFFIYRNPIQVGISIRRIAEALVSLRLMFSLPSFPNSAAFLFRQNGYVDVDFRGWTPKTGFEVALGFRVAATTTMRYLRYRKQGVVIHGLRYEVLRDNKEQMVNRILEVSGLPVSSLASKACEAFGRDSQEESPISQARLRQLIPTGPVVTPAMLDECRDMCKRLGIPDLDVWKDDSYCLPGSLTP